MMPLRDPAAELVLSRLELPDAARVGVFVPPARDFVVEVANLSAQVAVFALHYSELARLDRLPGNVTLSDGVFPSVDSGYDAGVIFIPKGRALLRMLLWQFARALKPGGKLYIAGANDAGVKSAIKDAGTLLGESVTLDYKARQRVGLAVKREDSLVYPSKWGEVLPNDPQPVTFDTPRGPVQLAAMPGVFSYGKLDEGTRFLLEHLELRDGEKRVLDLGCGLGVIGFALATEVEQVTLVDDNLLAVRCAEVSMRLSRFKHMRVLASDVYSTLENERFDLIVCNPPFHKGIDVTYGVTQRMIGEAGDHLAAGGRLVIVANAFLPYEALFDSYFPRWHEVARDNRYKVLAGYV